MPSEYKPGYAARFWARVDTSDPSVCWEWTGLRNAGTYGVVRIDKRQYMAHRVAWELATGETLERSTMVLHHCDNPPCINPAHLFTGDQSANMADMAAKGRRKGKGGGPTHWTKTRPEKLARGDAHWTRRLPECLARGDRNGSRLHPDKRYRGEQNGFSKLTAEQVLEMRSTYAAKEATQVELAARFGIKQAHVSAIVLRKVWRHLP